MILGAVEGYEVFLGSLIALQESREGNNPYRSHVQRPFPKRSRTAGNRSMLPEDNTEIQCTQVIDLTKMILTHCGRFRGGTLKLLELSLPGECREASCVRMVPSISPCCD